MKKYNKFIKETKIYQYVDNIITDIRNELNGNIDKLQYYFDLNEKYGIAFYINISKDVLKDIPIYNSNISALEIFNNEFNNFNIDFIIKDDKIDNDKFFSLLTHELTHIWQLLNDEYDESFNKMINIEDFKNKVSQYKLNFLNYIYMNFEHELNARLNQTYEYYKFKKISSADECINDFKNSSVYKDWTVLGDFNYRKHLIKYNNQNLLEFTNQFNLLYGIDEITVDKLEKYYDNWKIVFENNSLEYIKLCEDAIRKVFNNEKLTENEYYYMMDLCYFEPSLLENLLKIDIDIEILKLVEKFKKLKFL